MKTIKKWQRDAHALAVEKGFHSRICPECDRRPQGQMSDCTTCNGTGRVPIDPHSPTRIASRLALIHCEISEAVECVAHGMMELGYINSRGAWCELPELEEWTSGMIRNFKPEGFPIELADVFLRLCDLAESVGATIHVPRHPCRLNACETPEEIAAELSKLHALTSNLSLIVTQPPSAASDLFGRVYRKLNAIAVECNVDLLAMAELKHEYNRTRPIMHGGKVL